MRGVDDPLTIERVEIDAPRSDEVLIDVACVGLCHSDLKFLDGAFPVRLPAVLGHEASGVVADVGPDVTRIEPGDRVLTSLTVFCGQCPYCQSGRPHLCSAKQRTRRAPDERPRLSVEGQPVSQVFDLSSFAERMLVHESAVVVIDAETPFEMAALLGCGVSTGLGAVFNTANVQPGDTVAVVGCGGVGLSAIQAARVAQARLVVAVDTSSTSLALAEEMGATHTVNSSSEDGVAFVRAVADDLGADHVIEAVGSAETVRQGFLMTRPGGTTTVVGLIPHGVDVQVPSDALFYERRLQGSLMGSNDFQRDIPRYIQMQRDGVLQIDGIISRRIGLEDINDGFDLMREGAGGRTMVTL